MHVVLRNSRNAEANVSKFEEILEDYVLIVIVGSREEVILSYIIMP